MKIVIRPQARADIERVWRFSAKNWGRDHADDYVAQIAKQIEFAASLPGAGSEVYGLPPQYRKVRSGAHRMIYRCTDAELVVVRVVHEREDVAAQLEE